MSRRFVYFQGEQVPAPFKILLEGPDGFYVGGWNVSPVLVVGFSNSSYTSIRLRGITSTGPGENDWVVGGIATGRSGFNRSDIVFYTYSGLYRAITISDPGIPNFTKAACGGTFSGAGPFGQVARYYWATFVGSSGEATNSFNAENGGFGFVLPNFLGDRRLAARNEVYEIRRDVLVAAPLGYSLSRGDRSADTDEYPNGNPWLIKATGVPYTRIDTDLNAEIPRSDMYGPGLTLYARSPGIGASFTTPWTMAGTHSLTVTPWEISTSGACVEQPQFSVSYVAPNPTLYTAWDSSLYVLPT
jgi:hypothetical protein